VVLVPTASIRRIKGIHVLLEAAQGVPELEIWIAGDMLDPAAGGYAEQLLALSRLPKLSGRVHFLGFRRDIYSLMRVADLVCVPSVCREGFGLAAAEAMALGKPVIVSNRGGLPDVVQQGEAGIIIDPDRPQELTGALQRVVSDSQYAQRLGAHAASYARKRFSYDRWTREVAAVLKNASRKRPAETA
jgi:glycosyltransferase involved in cell wall biosynthesis